MKNETATLERATAEQGISAHSLLRDFGSAKESGFPIEANHEPVTIGRTKKRIGSFWSALSNLVKPTFHDMILLVCLLGLFCFYGFSCLIQTISKSAESTSLKKFTRSPGELLIISSGIFVVVTGLTGCVGYVGADVPGPAFVDVETPGVYVFGGHGHHFDRSYSHRGAVSRGWHR